MRIVLTILAIWVLLNILFVMLVIRPRKPLPTSRAKTLSPAVIERSQREAEPDEPLLLRHVIVSVAMGAFFVLAPPLIALGDTIIRFFRKPPRN
jgi:ABC-type dipeptide/oligopeptide/nickel transport system permease component